MKRILAILCVLGILSACTARLPELEDGVSHELAGWRKEHLGDLKYRLNFKIPASLQERIEGSVKISYRSDSPMIPHIDFKADGQDVKSVKVNGEDCSWKYEKEHIVILQRSVKNRTQNWEIDIDFTAPDMSLNRRNEFLYTLLVPDRARTLFPCFDQPNLKANYTLQLDTPKDWVAISNTSVQESSPGHYRFRESEPLSTYLFSFVAGKFHKETATRNGRSISMYHRENDPKKQKQVPDIFNEVFDALDWLEDYTAIKYPFEKYDLILLPGFQFGGMEHTGATLYNDRLFLGEHAGIQEKMSRFSLIAHETAHMWFGDLVTMDWFDEVWTKEVFANFFAAMMVSVKFEEASPGMTLANYARSAYAEDRTAGATPIKQELDNLKNAGLVYSNIVYDKSPIMMDMLAVKLGEKKFQQGIRTYLSNFAYANATWDDLIDIFDALTEEDLKQWSHNWIETEGMPHIKSDIVEREGEYHLQVAQSNPRHPEVMRDQKILYAILYKNGAVAKRTVDLKGAATEIEIGKDEVLAVFPNIDARGYGYFEIENPEQLTEALRSDGIRKIADDTFMTSTLANLQETYLNGSYAPESYGKFLLNMVKTENNPLLFSQAMGCLSGVHRKDGIENFDAEMFEIIESDRPLSCRRSAFSSLKSGMTEKETVEKYYQYFMHPESFRSYRLSVNDLTSLSYELAIRYPERSAEIVALQKSRITNPDRLESYNFISRALSPDKASRDSLFRSLLDVENRSVEPWASSTLSLLNHRLRHDTSREYIRAGLEELQEVQQTGDIFFPKGWISSLLSSYTKEERAEAIHAFLKDHPDYPPMLRNKILQMIQYDPQCQASSK